MNRKVIHEYIKAIYDKPITNKINGGKLKASLKLRIRYGCLLLPFLFNIVLEIQVRALRQENKSKVIQIRKTEVNFYLFAGDMIYIENPKDLTKKLL